MDANAGNARKTQNPTKETPPERNGQSETEHVSIGECMGRLFLSIPLIFCVLLLLGAGGGLAIGILLSDDDDSPSAPNPIPKSVNVVAPTAVPQVAPTKAPTTKAPTSLISPTTTMDPIQNDGVCEFTTFMQPHVIDQCICFGAVAVLDDTISQNHGILKNTLMLALYQGYNESTDSCSARNQALLWLSSGNGPSFEVYEQRQRFALAMIFITLNGQSWQRNANSFANNWLSTLPSCKWEGIECDDDNAVVSLQLDSANATGRLPREVVLLRQLQRLSLFDNAITGDIPPDLFVIDTLEYIDLSQNNLSGTLPSEFSGAKSLNTILLSGNELAGSVAGNICDLRSGAGSLEEFVVDCPTADGQGLDCDIPNCCTSCA